MTHDDPHDEKPVSVRLRAVDRERLDALCKITDLRASDVIRTAIKRLYDTEIGANARKR